MTGKKILAVNVFLPRLIKWPVEVGEFVNIVEGREIVNVDRRGKYLLLQLTGGVCLVIHLRMTGRLFTAEAGSPPDKYARVIFQLEDGLSLIFADSRTLGVLYALKESELNRIPGLANLGPEPLAGEFSFGYLKNIISKRRGTIKGLLLDQRIIGGLGNIYVDESLSLAGIYPGRSACSLNDLEIERLYSAINSVITDGINHGGTTFRDYRDGDGKPGRHQNYLRVYGRTGKPCPECGTAIVKEVIAGRGTHYCPHCQH